MPPILKYIPKAGLLTWAFLVLVFADAANLDDIFLSANVVHDDSEMIAPPVTHDDPGPAPAQDGGHHHESGRIIVDQDSPSLAAVDEAESIHFCIFPAPDKVERGAGFRSDDQLHIKIRQLLI